MQLTTQRPDNFMGLGIILYTTTEGLPVVPLGSRLDSERNLPISNTSNVVNALASLATRESTMHDGFHLIEAKSGDLTHIAQFVSPPLSVALANPSANWPQGARQMTALLISTLPQVEVAAVISAEGSVQLFEDGIEQKIGVLE
ncbi:hypothetical protein ABN225_13235 [Providencia alcalifaciens]